jgi:hypothetical protein
MMTHMEIRNNLLGTGVQVILIKQLQKKKLSCIVSRCPRALWKSELKADELGLLA